MRPVIAVILAAVWLPSFAEAQVTVFEDTNYKGASKVLKGGMNLFNVPPGHKYTGDKMFPESLKVPPGYYAVVRLEGGTRMLVKSNTPDLFNDVLVPAANLPGGMYRAIGIAALRKKIMSVRVGKFTTTPDAKVITFVGTNVKYTADELRAFLKTKKKTLVKTADLDPGECTISYMNSNRDGLSADAGLLACNVKLADGSVALQSMAVYGGCDLAAGGKQARAACEVGVLKGTITLKGPGGTEIALTVKGPNANACASVSESGACMSGGVELAGASTTVTDPLGNSAGVGVGVGVAFGGAATLDDGAIGVNANVKLGIGMNVNFGVNYKKTGRAIITLGDTAYGKVGPTVVASSFMAGNFAKDSYFRSAVVVNSGVVGIWKDGSSWTVSVATSAGKGVEAVGTAAWKGTVRAGEAIADVAGDAKDFVEDLVPW